MEKFALLNLLKAIDGLKNMQPTQNGGSPSPSDESSSAQHTSPSPAPPASPAPSNASGYNPAEKELPNIMLETLMRHEQISYRIKNKR